jgi:hypothetical protein
MTCLVEQISLTGVCMRRSPLNITTKDLVVQNSARGIQNCKTLYEDRAGGNKQGYSHPSDEADKIKETYGSVL